MLAPIVTKDMKLFPSQPLPPRVKNVRSRAQSLQDFANGNAIHISSGQNNQTPNGTYLLNPNNVRGVVPNRSRNSRSIGSLPITNSLATSGFQNNSTVANPAAKTPPKYSTSSASLRKPLDSIVEGVELAHQGQGSSKTSSSAEENQKKQAQPKKVLLKQSASTKEDCRKGVRISAKSCPHRSNEGIAIKKAEKEKRTRTNSMEGGRKKKSEGRANTSSGGCFAMWLGSKFRKGANGQTSTDSNSSTNLTAKEEQEIDKRK